MRIIARKTLKEFWKKHKDAEKPLESWFAFVKAANWLNSIDVKRDYKNASFLKNNRVVFNIKGNAYRLITLIHYDFSVVYIRFIGTHAEYDKIDGNSI
jgi:mRNA interferase HigB